LTIFYLFDFGDPYPWLSALKVDVPLVAFVAGTAPELGAAEVAEVRPLTWG